jgi:hypothetical protein
MKRVPWLLALVSAVLLSAASVPADDGFYVIAAGRPSVGTKITSLPYTISTSGYYFLTGNLSYSGGHGITVNCDNVTIDLMGFRVAGPANNNYCGVFINSGNNVEVRNGTLAGWYEGVYSNTGSRQRLINVRAHSDTYGFYLNGDDHLIQLCSAIQGGFGAGTGIVLNGSGKVSGTTVMNFANYGIYIGTGGTATGNLVQNCADTGIYAYSGTTLISYNHVDGCRYGIASGGAGGSIIGNVVMTPTGQNGIGILPSVYLDRPNVLDQNTVNGSDTQYGDGTTATVWGLNAGGWFWP